MRARVLVVVVAVSVFGGIAFRTTHETPASPRKTARSAYTTADIIEYLAFSQGPVARDHPVDGTRIEAPGTRPESRLRTIAQSMSECVHRLDAAAGPRLAAAFNTADPQRLDRALRRFDAAATRWLTSPTQIPPCPPPPPPPSVPPAPSPYLKVTGVGAWDYVLVGWDFYAVAATIGAAAALSGIIAVAYAGLIYEAGLFATTAVIALEAFFVPVLLSYEFENTPTELDRQIAIAKIVEKLRT